MAQRNGERLRELVAEVWLAEVRPGSLPDAVVADHDIDWTDPRRPSVTRARVFRFADDDIWEQLGAHRPAWVNVSTYPLDDGRLVIVVLPARHSAEHHADAAISLATSPPETVLTLADDDQEQATSKGSDDGRDQG